MAKNKTQRRRRNLKRIIKRAKQREDRKKINNQRERRDGYD